MPADRLTHPRIGHSRKVSTLDHFHYRVWDTYKWTADDFGVMPKSAAVILGANRAFERDGLLQLAAALDHLVAVDLLHEFTHQGEPYVCSLTWQTHQKIQYPRVTHYPCPPVEVVDLMDVPTRKLFRKSRKDSRKFSKTSGLARVRARETLSLTQTADANADAQRDEPDRRETKAHPIRDVLEHYVQRYLEAVGQRPHIDGGKDAGMVAGLLKQHDADTVHRTLDAFFDYADDFVRKRGYALGLFKSQFNAWLAKAAPAKPKGDFYGHVPHCASMTDCTARMLREEAEKRKAAAS